MREIQSERAESVNKMRFPGPAAGSFLYVARPGNLAKIGQALSLGVQNFARLKEIEMRLRCTEHGHKQQRAACQTIVPNMRRQIR